MRNAHPAASPGGVTGHGMAIGAQGHGLGGQLPEEVAARLGATPAGLSAAEADARLRTHGRNQLQARAGALPLAVLVSQFRSPFVLILVAAAVLSFAVGEPDEATIIIAIVIASSALGFFQEYRAANTVAALRSRLSTRAAVRRDGVTVRLDVGELVPGDVVELAGGSMIAADGLLLDAASLNVDEAPLTGESFPAAKHAAVPGTPLDADALVSMGTSVRSGTGLMLVSATGQATQYGRIAASSSGVGENTSFARGVRRFGLLMTQTMVVIVLIVLPVNLLLQRPLIESVLFAAALAVGLTPELLPAIVTVTLARGARRLAASGVLVKRLVAIENLGAMDVLCTDKTGTLTEGALAVSSFEGVDGGGSARVAACAWLNARHQTGLPNPMDEAILAQPGPTGGTWRKLGEIAYDFERKRLSVAIDDGSGPMLVCKGAVDGILSLCADAEIDGALRPFDDALKAAEEARVAAWCNAGLRALAVATRRLAPDTALDPGAEVGLTLVGYVLFADPIKAGVSETIGRLRERGVALKIITGDNRYVAAHVAAAVGLSTRRVLTGEDLLHLNRRRLQQRLTSVDVFAEVTPDQKERIIEAFRLAGHVVGYMGDGINDAPALRAADLGISVEGAVEAAREAADVVLLRQDLGVLLDGVVNGRASFANTLKYVAITTSANLGNMLSMAVASMALPFLPMLAKQILINNFLSDLPLLAVSTDSVDEQVLERPGRWDFRELLGSMLGFGLVSSLFDAMTFATLLLLYGDTPALVQTGWFVESLLSELAIVFVMRTRLGIFSSRPGGWLLGISVVVALCGVALPYLPFSAATGLVPLPLPVLLGLFAIVLAYGGASELLKRRLWARANAIAKRKAASPHSSATR
jgi:P-type Mg2+ transporter